MVWVNLLPWRTRQLQARLHRWYLVWLVLMVGFLYALLPVAGQQAVNVQWLQMVQRQREGGQRLAELNKRITARRLLQEQLERQLTVHLQQQQRMNQWLDFTQRLAEQLPETLWLSELIKTPERLTLAGFCLAMADIDDFRQRLQQSALFSQVTSGKLSRSQDGVIHFSLQAVLRSAAGERGAASVGRIAKGEGR
ncbi:hypothetical protein EH228_07555 [Erwinia endophytica]|uniref:PilN domain-containing protein n=1 Tax=Erwinia endophytica TaxID=1563158 RepID=UPI001265E569|nr:PilN domain-containing protein [Erwinia endophytica]KAB8312373.1 hypothetical protein EH228_07555 [Erwinia endophytica]